MTWVQVAAVVAAAVAAVAVARAFAASTATLCTQPSEWGDSSRKFTSSLGGFAANGVVVMQFTVPLAPASLRDGWQYQLGRVQDPATLRHMTLSQERLRLPPDGQVRR